ncbi:hypothetical protein [Gluconacetobacter johannae]|uniref:Uncharacterized protein n=1 Tax=Gluconacetobacter johannae TaxID=112140 RepID=A0A7W4J8P6_9PROT|nr:hypothetical protein [Gluconacetobacter johannae]MBB2176750.1 hypothetical protein [Gluconacetobacter johannae]
MTEAVVEEFSDLVSQTVESRRKGRGIKAAIHEAARVLGLTERRVRACLYREIRSVTAAEWLSVRARFAAHLEAEARRLDAEADLIRVRLDALRNEAA